MSNKEEKENLEKLIEKADLLIETGKYEEAKKIIEYCSLYNAVLAIDVRDLLDRLISKIEKAN